MNQDYFRQVRREIEPLLPGHATRILDVGCGAGATARWLKQRYPAAHVIGWEGNAALAPDLAANVDEARIVDLNAALPDPGPVDLVLFLDVLEHLERPGEVLAQVTASLSEQGTVIVSLPNVAHLSVSLPLLLGRFTYQDAGILDRTHRHFFVRRSVVALLNSAGLDVKRGIRNGLEGPRARLLLAASGGLLRDHLTKQYVVAARPRSHGGRQSAVTWQASPLQPA
jgi:2-polyprenyl-3-methyl-5-hydroxy-6-metoxy-1,4-benzoquinol methylase